MTPAQPRLIPLGSARVLTRDGAGDTYLELNVRNGKYPIEG